MTQEVTRSSYISSYEYQAGYIRILTYYILTAIKMVKRRMPRVYLVRHGTLLLNEKELELIHRRD
jgi:hypothetical protein